MPHAAHTTSPSDALIIVNGDHVQVVGPDGIARALAGSLPPGLGWPGAAEALSLSPADALALGGVASTAPPTLPPPLPQQHPGAVLRADGGVAFVLYLAIGFASTLACIATLVGAFYVARALSARTAADAAAAAAAAAVRDEEEGGAAGRPPPKPTVVVVHPGGAAVGVGVEECTTPSGGAGMDDDDDEENVAPLPKFGTSPGKGESFVGRAAFASSSKPPTAGASPAALAVAALPLEDDQHQPGPSPATTSTTPPTTISARHARPQSPAAAAVAAVSAAVSAAAAAAAAAAGMGGGEGGEGGSQPTTNTPSPPSSGLLRRLRGFMLARPASPAPAVGEP